MEKLKKIEFSVAQELNCEVTNLSFWDPGATYSKKVTKLLKNNHPRNKINYFFTYDIPRVQREQTLLSLELKEQS